MDQAHVTYIGIAAEDGQTFANASSNDLIMFTPDPSKLLMGTKNAFNSQMEISASRVVINDDATVYGRLQVAEGASIAGTTTIYNDLFVQGNLITRQDLVITGVQVATGASYCNGDLFVTNDMVGMPFSNATMYVSSREGLPILSLQQTSNVSTRPFIIYQNASGDGYIMNTRNTYIGSQSHISSNITRHVIVSSNGNMGIGTSNPRQKLDVFQGNVNAQNIMRLCKSTASSNPLNINISWTSNVAGPQHSIILETTQQYGTPAYQGTRKQDHKLTLASPFNHIPQVARGFGDKESYTSMFITASNTSPTSISISSTVIGAPAVGTSNITHELDINITIAPSVLGHVWMS